MGTGEIDRIIAEDRVRNMPRGTNVPVSRADRIVTVELVNPTTGERCHAGQSRSFAPTDADRAWVERELGDVPVRTLPHPGSWFYTDVETWSPGNVLGTRAGTHVATDRDIPYESLGRDA